MKLEVLLVSGERRPLQPGTLAAFEPKLPGLRDGAAAALGGVDAVADIDRDDGVVRIGVALLGEGLDVPVAVLVAVIHDPSFLRLARGRHPLASAN